MLPRLAAVLLLASGGLLVGGVATPASVSALAPDGASAFVAVTPTRLADTRPSSGAYGFAAVNANTIRVVVAGRGGVPLDATAVVLSVTAVGFGGAGYVTVFATGDAAPAEANLVADARGPIIANTVHVRLGEGGAIDLRRTTAVNLIVDVVGAYVPAPEPVAAGRLDMPPAGSLRVTSGAVVHAGSTSDFDLTALGVPADATGVVLSLAVRQTGRGNWVAHETGTPRPNITTLTIDTVAQVRSNLTVVPLSGTRPSVSVFAGGGGILVMELLGWYTGASAPVSTDGLFIPITHRRQLDTRIGRSLPPFGPAAFEFASGSTESVKALVGNLWTADGWDAGAVRTRAAGTNLRPDSVVSTTAPRRSATSHFLARTSTRGVAVNTTAGAHLMVDVAGWFLGSPPTATLPVPVNRAFTPTRVTQVRWTDAGGTKVREVRTPATSADLNLNRIANSRIGAAYKDHSTLGQRGNVMIFGHRTVYGAMFRYLNTVPIGSTFSLLGADGHWYNYRVTHVGVTSPTYGAIAQLAAPYPPATAQLVACSRLNGTATSLLYRIVVTGQLVSVT